MAGTERSEESGLKLVFLGTSAAIQVPSFHCTCAVCAAARRNPDHRRTRASLALIGQETTLIDAGPDLELQLEREGIRQVDRIFITHWHFDHIAGLAALAEPASHTPWPPIELYLPHQVAYHLYQELAYMRPQINLHPIEPGDRWELPDATWEVVKTTHNEHSVGFIVEAAQKFAYLVDGVTPPPATLARLADLDFVILEASVDELDELEDVWLNFSLDGAVACWRRIGTEKCVLTHWSGHSWQNKRLLAGLSDAERRAYETATPGLRFAYDGMTLTLAHGNSERDMS
jgi:phosphoribosyl 1,2-cyclic phosphate phosphodiesterase